MVDRAAASIRRKGRSIGDLGIELIARIRYGVKASSVATPLLLLFFFSRRRRHTRYIGDWSSDVCSSDLFLILAVIAIVYHNRHKLSHPGSLGARTFGGGNNSVCHFIKKSSVFRCKCSAADIGRSEERRVGKERRSRRVRVEGRKN